MSKAQLLDLVEKTGARTVTKLLFHAKKHGLNPTKENLRAVVASLGEKQLFLPVRPSKGKVASEGPGKRWQMDLADLRLTPSEGQHYFLCIIDVFSRQLAAFPLKDKKPETVVPVLKRWVDDTGVIGQIFSDQGAEFQGPVAEMLEKEGIIHRTKTSRLDKNSTAVVDKAIQSLKGRMAELMAAKSDLGWTTALAKAVEQYGEDYNSAIRDEPDQVGDGTEPGKVLQFMLFKDNAKKIQHNQKLLERRTAQLEELGAFRAPLPDSTMKFKRGFKATYGEVEKVQKIEGSKVTGDKTTMDIKLLLPVSADTGAARATFTYSSAQKQKKRNELIQEGFLDALNEKIPEEGRIALTMLAREMRKEMGANFYDDLVNKIFKNVDGKLAAGIRLFPEFFKLEQDELYVRREE